MIKKWLYKLRYILIIFSALLWILGLSSSFWFYQSWDIYWFECYWSNCTYYLIPINWSWTNNLTLSSIKNHASADLNFNSEYWNFIYNPSTDPYWRNYSNWAWFWYDHKLYYYWYWTYTWAWSIFISQYVSQWYVYQFCLADTWTFLDKCVKNSTQRSPMSIFYQSYDPLDFNWLYFYSRSADGGWVFDSSFLCLRTVRETFYCFMWTSESENFTLVDTPSIDQVQNIYWKWTSPFFPWGGGGWFDSWGGALWGIEITNDMVIKNYNSMGWNKAICYAWEWSGWQLVSAPWTWFSVFDLFSSYNPLWFSDITDWYDYYRYWFQDNPNIATTWSVFAWDWVFHAPLHSLFAMWYKNGVWVLFPSADIIEYCDLVINSDRNAKYTWDLTTTEQTIITNNYYNNYYYNNSDYDFEYTWAISTLTWFWEDFDWDSLDAFQELYKRFANWLWQLNWNLVGIIPNYILVFLFALIFIRILRK